MKAPASTLGSAPQAVTVMSHRYAGDKTTTAAKTKLACFVAIDTAVANNPKPTWDALRDKAIPVSALPAFAASACWGGESRGRERPYRPGPDTVVGEQ